MAERPKPNPIIPENTAPDVAQAVLEQGGDALPPAGYKRDEALALRKENLEQEAEWLAEQMIVGNIPDKFKQVDNEIANRLQFLSVINAREDMHYVWVNYINDHGWQVSQKQDLGYEVVGSVSDRFPESPELEAEDGTRRIGDVMLMRVPKERALYITALNRKRDLERRGILQNGEALAELAHKHTGGKIRIHTTLSEEHKRIAETRVAQRYDRMQRAYQNLGQRLQGGRVLNESHFAGRV